MLKRYIFFVHGWAESSAIWSGVLDLLPESLNCLSMDRGYFSPSFLPFFPENARITLVAHSFGLYLVPDFLWGSIDSAILISAFDDFLPSDSRKKRYVKSLLYLMEKRLEEYPLETVQAFKKLCGQEEVSKDTALNSKLLKEDLKRLGSEKLNSDFLIDLKKLYILYGLEDGVVDISCLKSLHKKLPFSKLLLFKDNKHNLPFTKAACIAEIIEKFL